MFRSSRFQPAPQSSRVTGRRQQERKFHGGVHRAKWRAGRLSQRAKLALGHRARQLNCFTRSFHQSRVSSAELSQQTKDIVKATAPVLAEHGYAITRTMYGKMLTENPDVKAMFNPTHQVELPGDLHAKQPWTLACSVHAYAANVDNLEALADAVERIAQKHVSLNVLPEHYPVVGKNILWAIKEVLGDAATPEIMQAWEEAFGALAEIFIQRETQIREGRGAEAGGWEGWRDFTVVRKVNESHEICSFYLSPSDGKQVLSYEPGQYVAIRVETPEFTTQRNYTLSCKPGTGQYRITVKRHGPLVDGAPKGQVSNWLHDQINEGDTLKVGVPCGDFVMKDVVDEKPIVLLSGGVGLTPTVSMLEYLVDKGVKNNIVMVNSARSPEVEAMHDELAAYRRKHLNLLIKTMYDEGSDEYPQGPITTDKLDQVLATRDCHYYFCGPPKMMHDLYKGLKSWDIPEDQIHYEFFGAHEDIMQLS